MKPIEKLASEVREKHGCDGRGCICFDAFIEGFKSARGLATQELNEFIDSEVSNWACVAQDRIKSLGEEEDSE